MKEIPQRAEETVGEYINLFIWCQTGGDGGGEKNWWEKQRKRRKESDGKMRWRSTKDGRVRDKNIFIQQEKLNQGRVSVLCFLGGEREVFTGEEVWVRRGSRRIEASVCRCVPAQARLPGNGCRVKSEPSDWTSDVCDSALCCTAIPLWKSNRGLEKFKPRSCKKTKKMKTRGRQVLVAQSQKRTNMTDTSVWENRRHQNKWSPIIRSLQVWRCVWC